ncbi:MAG: hypothetical protein HYX24_02385 [Candidatus Aenigmarchaeota archaeon]|nr:hypothetical protein [Candidatus Aenigmarchaeota archaeon]
MKTEKKIQIGLTAGVVIIAAIVFLSMNKNIEGKYDSFAKCLTDSGAKMYGAFWCPHCEEQKKMFSTSWSKVNYIECSNADRTQTEVCKQARITGYPTWEFRDGKRAEGLLTFEKLSQMSGCSLGG